MQFSPLILYHKTVYNSGRSSMFLRDVEFIENEQNTRDGIILLHGIGRTRRNMRPLERFLEAKGYRTLNISYPSTRLSIIKNAEFVQEVSRDFVKETKGKLHIVAFSMGGLVTRAFLSKYRPDQLGRVVMIGTPNHGSQVADFLANLRAFKFLYGPAGQQLTTSNNGFDDLPKEIDFELGVIAGRTVIHPFSALVFKEESDGIVSVESTKIRGMKDHIVIPHSHTALPLAKATAELCAHFLKEGHFGSGCEQK